MRMNACTPERVRLKPRPEPPRPAFLSHAQTRGHQRGGASYSTWHAFYAIPVDDGEPLQPCKVLVRAGKAVCPEGRLLLKRA